MKTLELSTGNTDITAAAGILQNHGLVVFPTETVYGLGAAADSASAVEKVYRAKNRPADNPLIVHVNSIEMADEYASRLSAVEKELLLRFSPGPFTLIADRNPLRAAAAAAGHPGIGLRIPACPAALQLISAFGSGIAAPSANRSGRPSPTDFSMAWEEMAGRVDAVIHGEPSHRGLESTIVRCSGSAVHVLRPGSVTASMLEHGLRDAGIDMPVQMEGGAQAPPAPGTKYRHYAPLAEIILFTDPAELKQLMSGQNNSYPGDVMLLLPGEGFEAGDAFSSGELELLSSSAPALASERSEIRVFRDAESYAHGLYRSFVEADRLGLKRVYAYLPENDPASEALKDRLIRAAEK